MLLRHGLRNFICSVWEKLSVVKMIDLKNHRVIDLSQELRPGILKVSGEYLHMGGMPPYGNRRLELRQWIYQKDQHFMHWVETETHIGTHVEAPSHLNLEGKEGGRSVSEFPAERWIGEAVVLNFSGKKPLKSTGQPITASDLEGVKEGDIVLMWSPYPEYGDEAPYISKGAAQHLIRKRIKQLGLMGVRLGEAHNPLLKNDIPIIEGLVNLDKIGKDRVFYIGLPLRWYGLDACAIRAVALEEK